MQEDVESRAVNLAISTSKLTARSVISAVRSYLKHRMDDKPVGKQSVKQLLKQDQGASSIDIAKTDLRGLQNIARKYGIDYAIRKDSSVFPPKYLVFFKAKDADVMTAAFSEYSHKALRRETRPSIRKQLAKFKELAASLPAKAVTRDKQREQIR